ncbi:MAG: hypothetical protein IPK14_02870 [Blastocatellia bacterium]|nr:hypothetical protein [Blastocatellia bacterium]
MLQSTSKLTYLRRALEIAKQQGWIIRNPFNQGDALISIACEQKRERILTKEEETRLLEACLGTRLHLRPKDYLFFVFAEFV